MAQRSTQPGRPQWWKTPEFLRSLPLFVLADVFFIAGAVLRFAYPTYALYGPGVFTFWALLITLGFTCTIGGVISWTLGSDSTPAPARPAAPSRSPTYLPIDFPESAKPTPSPEPPPPIRARTEFGRPAPDIRPAAAAGDWNEGPTDSERFVGTEYIVPIESPTLAEAVSDEGGTEAEPVERVLADLERIERELAPRARVVEPSSS
jgi:hypothetical protein